MSITNLYRSSRSTSKRAYNSGYAAACADLLQMIQQGVSDSETPPTIGRVMDWVEARLEAVRAREEEEDEEDEENASKKDGGQATKLRASSTLPRPNSAPAVSQQTPREQVRSGFHYLSSCSALFFLHHPSLPPVSREFCCSHANGLFFSTSFFVFFWAFLGTACAVEIIATDRHRTDRSTFDATLSTGHRHPTTTYPHGPVRPHSQTPRICIIPPGKGEPHRLNDDHPVGCTSVPDIPRVTVHVHRVPVLTLLTRTVRAGARDPAAAHRGGRRETPACYDGARRRHCRRSRSRVYRWSRRIESQAHAVNTWYVSESTYAGRDGH